METRTISEEQWIEFFDRFSREHVGCPVTIKVLDKESGPLNIAEGLALEGISFDTKGTRPCAIEISMGDRPDGHVNHVIDMPLHIRELEGANGEIDVQIEPATGPITLIHVSAPVD
ncbi:MAG TPA: DUF5335 family protein [Tepidisphaeraceae bacterium]|jgi:hypothetical protein|nr:DUF5335 family protein [Tepidisphaeraceae bacterium]